MRCETPSLLIASMGGVGSTVLMEFLSRQPELCTNRPHGIINPLKHPVRPPELPSVQRAIFVFGCPLLSLLSLFRRGCDAVHYANISGALQGESPDPPDPWTETCERFGLTSIYREGRAIWVDQVGRYASDIGAVDWFLGQKARRESWRARIEAKVQKCALDYGDLDGYLAQGKDLFRRAEQVEQWFGHRPAPAVDYPALLVRYEALWEHLPQVLDFARLPAARAAGFCERRPRRSSLEMLSEAQRDRLLALYGDLKTKIDAAPDLLERS